MWDRTKIEFNHPEKIFHEHKRAPTDESIRLAMEYEEKILKKIVDKFQCCDNKINLSFFRINDVLRSFYVVKLKINGNEFSQTFDIKIQFDEMVDDIVNWISYKILQPFIQDMFVTMKQGTS